MACASPEAEQVSITVTRTILMDRFLALLLSSWATGVPFRKGVNVSIF